MAALVVLVVVIAVMGGVTKAVGPMVQEAFSCQLHALLRPGADPACGPPEDGSSRLIQAADPGTTPLRERLRNGFWCRVFGGSACTLRVELRTGRGQKLFTVLPFVTRCHDGVCIRMTPERIEIRPGRERDFEYCFLKPNEPEPACMRFRVPAGQPIPARIFLKRPPIAGHGGVEVEFEWRRADARLPKHVTIDIKDQTRLRQPNGLFVTSAEPVTVEMNVDSRVGNEPPTTGTIKFVRAQGTVGVDVTPSQAGGLPRRIEAYGPLPALEVDIQKGGARLRGTLKGIPDHVVAEWRPGAGGGRLLVTPEGGRLESLDLHATGVSRMTRIPVNGRSAPIDDLSARLGPVGRVDLTMNRRGFTYTGDPISGDVRVGASDPSGGANCATESGVWMRSRAGEPFAARGCVAGLKDARLSVDGRTGLTTGRVETTGPSRPFSFKFEHDEGTALAHMERRPRMLQATLDPRGALEIRGPGLSQTPVDVRLYDRSGRPTVSILDLRVPDSGTVCWDLSGPRCRPDAPPWADASLRFHSDQGAVQAERIFVPDAFGNAVMIEGLASGNGSLYWAGGLRPALGIDGTLSSQGIRVFPHPPAPCPEGRGRVESAFCEMRRGAAEAATPLHYELSPARLRANDFSIDCRDGLTRCRSTGTLTCDGYVELRLNYSGVDPGPIPIPGCERRPGR